MIYLLSLIMLLIQVLNADWLLIDSSFTDSQVSSNSWTIKNSCGCSSGNNCDENFNTDKCESSNNNNVNPLNFVKMENGKERLYKSYSYKSFQAKIIFDVFYNYADGHDDSSLSVDYQEGGSSNSLYSKTYQNPNLNQQSNRICLGGNDREFDLYTVTSSVITNFAEKFYINFCFNPFHDNNSQYITVGIRNVLVYANACYPRCKTCSGSNYNQCSDCYYGSNSAICQCDPKHQFAETAIGCRQECERDYFIANSNLICVVDRRISSKYTYFDSNSISDTDSPRYQPFIFIADPFHYQNTDLIYDDCDSNDFVGELYYNEAMQLQMEKINALKFIRLRMNFYFFNLQTDSKINIFLDDVLQSEIKKTSSSFSFSNAVNTNTYTDTCDSKAYILIRIEAILRPITLTPVLLLQGSLVSGTESWGFRNVTIDVGLCSENCKTCSGFFTCSECESGYTLYQNGCVQSCPIYSSNCVDYSDEYPYSRYLVKGFYDINMTTDDIERYYDNVTNSGGNFKTGQKFSFFPNQIVLGGVMVWYDASYFKDFSITKPHYAVTIRFNLTFGDEYSGSFKYRVDTTWSSVYTKPDGSGQTNILGKSDDERIKFVHIYLNPYPAASLNLELKCAQPSGGSDIRDGFCAISEYFIVVHYCPPFCDICSSATACSAWQGGHTDSSCAANQYLSLDSSTSIYSCVTCTQVGCLTCNSLDECTSCTYTAGNKFYLSNGVCLCYPFTYLSSTTCTICNKYCENCFGSNSNNCLSCVSEFHRSLSNNQCICQPGYYDTYGYGNHLPCQSICGDQLIVDGEDCDDGNFDPFDGCDQCNYSCDGGCSICISGICEDCKDGYQLVENHCFITYEYSCSPNCTSCSFGICYQCNEANGWYLRLDNSCQPICGDIIISSPYETCDDGNDFPYDGCYQCQQSCVLNCEACSLGFCSSCKQGFAFSPKTKQCVPICGDGIITLEETCDDNNSNLFDGCYKCQLSCQSACTQCSAYGCLECNTIGWEYNSITSNCKTVCGDGIIILEQEECDDGISSNCVNCKYQCQESCLLCYFGKCKQCKTGWSLNITDEYCYYISGDSLVVGSEQCDDYNLFAYDGCYQSNYQCQQSCKTCIFGKCGICLTGFESINGVCVEIKNDGLVVGLEQCDDTNIVPFDGCQINRYDCPVYCSSCVKGECLKCKITSGYGYLDTNNNVCTSICGDTIVAFDEDCDDGNTQPYDGCFQCQYQCHQECTICQKGRCLECIDGYYVSDKTNQCINECGDQIVRGDEYCDDGNQVVTDGCADCKFQCHQQCSNCVEGLCYECQGVGWEINIVARECQPICGDGIVIGSEQCDDANDIQEDGCYQCYFECQRQCTKCVKGYCEECNTIGWELEWNSCIPTCGDKIVIVDYEECDDGNITPYDGCFDCKYQCQEQCTDCKLGVCQACDVKGWKIANNICYAFCGDGYVVQGQEQCDDGNEMQFDGCYQCQYQCEEMCTTCEQGICYDCNNLGWIIDNNHKCMPFCGDGLVMGYEQCDDMNDDFNDGCYQCRFACDQYCTDCQEGVCMECEAGRFVEQNICYAVCGDGYFVISAEQCDDGNDDIHDGCNADCKVETDWVCINNEGTASTCFYSQQPDFKLELITTAPEDVEDVKLTFTQSMKLASNAKGDLTNYIIADISNLQNNGYLITQQLEKVLSQEEISEVIVSLKINFYVPVDKPILSITFIGDPILSEYNLTLKSTQQTLQLLTPMVLSQTQKVIAQSASTFNEAIIYSLVGLSSLCIATGSSDIFWNLMDQLQYLSYIKYINIQFPNNLNIYYDVFKLVTISPLMQKTGIDKIFGAMDGGSTYNITTTNKFAKDGINAYFFLNFQSFLFVLLGGFSGYWATKYSHLLLYRLGPYYMSKLNFTISKFILGMRRKLKVKSKQFYYNGILRIIMSNCYDMSFATAMQLANYQGGNSVLVINYYLAVIVCIAQFGISLFFMGIMSNFTNQASTKSKEDYDALFEGVLKDKSVWIMQYNSLLLFKKQIFIFLIVFMQQDGQIQTLCIAFFQTIFLSYLIINKPLTNLYEYYKSVITEILIIFNTVTFLFYAYRVEMSLTLDDSINLGWVHIFTSTMVLAVSFLFDFIQQSKILYEKLRLAIQGPQIEEGAPVTLFY